MATVKVVLNGSEKLVNGNSYKYDYYLNYLEYGRIFITSSLCLIKSLISW
jgi:hypothetical protein